MKRLLALLLAAILLLGLAACGAKPADDTDTPAAATAQTGEGEYHGELPFVKEGDEPITLSIALISSANVTDYKDNAYTKWLEEQTGLNLEFVQFMDGSTAATQVALMIASGEKLPDIIWRVNSISKQQSETYGQEGYFLPLTEYFEKYGYYFRESYLLCYDGDPTMMELTLRRAAGADNQPIYSFPTLLIGAVGDPLLQPWINQDWLDKLGLKAPETVEELYDVLVAFRDQDPNGNGKKDEIPLCGKVANGSSTLDPTNWIINAFVYYNSYTWFTIENGKVGTPYKSDEYREALKYINKLYKEGLITELSWTQTAAELKGIINPAEGDPYLAGVVCYPGTSMFVDNSDSLRAYVPLKPLQDATGKGGYTLSTYAHGQYTHITTDCEHPVEAFKLLDFMCSQENYLRQRYGEYGVDWVYSEGGKPGNRGGEAKIKLLNPNVYNEQNAQCWHYLGGVADESYWEYEIDTTNPDDWQTQKVMKLNEVYEIMNNWRKPEEIFDFAIYSLEDYEERSEFVSDLTGYIGDRRTQFCTGVLDPNSDADWEEYLKGLDTYRYDRWIEIGQIGYDRMFE